MYLYSALFVVPHTQGAQAWITQCYLQLHQCLPLPCLPRLRLRISNCSLLLIYLPQKDERLSRPGWLTYVRFTHISGHPSAAGRAQDRESSPVKDRRSTKGVVRWLSGRASDLRSSSRGFEARPRRCCVTTLGKLFTPYCLCHQAV